MAPKVQFLFAGVAVFGRAVCHVAGMVYVLRVSRVRKPRDDGHHLLAARRRPWPPDFQSVDIAGIDGLDDFLPNHPDFG